MTCWTSSSSHGYLEVYGTNIHLGVVFFVERWSFSLQDPIFLVSFGIFRFLFELDLLLWLTRNPKVELCVIIAIIQGMHVGTVGSCRKEIEGFSVLMNH